MKFHHVIASAVFLTGQVFSTVIHAQTEFLVQQLFRAIQVQPITLLLYRLLADSSDLVARVPATRAFLC